MTIMGARHIRPREKLLNFTVIDNITDVNGLSST